MVNRLLFLLTGLLPLLAGSVVLAAPASAHGVSGKADVRFAQTIAGMELTVVIRATDQVPGPLHVDVIAHRPVRELRIALALRSAAGGRTSTGSIRLARGRPGAYPAVLHAARTGPHILELRAGQETGRLPFRVLTPRPAPWELAAYGGFGTAGALLVGALTTGALRSGDEVRRRSGRPGPRTSPAGRGGRERRNATGRVRRVCAAACGGGAVVAVAVGVTAALLSTGLPPPEPDGAPGRPERPAYPGSSARQGVLGRPYAQVMVDTVPADPRTGEEFTLWLRLVDGATGRPADDLVVHHAALAHVVVVSRDGMSFRHVHPVRTAPGKLAVRLTVERPGRYFAYAEFERADSGGQLVSGAFDVSGRPAGPGGVAPPGPDTPRRLERRQAIAGRSVRIEVDTGSADLQPWLGMAGHLIVRDDSGGFLGHVHEQSSMVANRVGPASGVQPPDETVAGYGPILRFTFAFPEPGRYLAWVQYMRDFEIVTERLVFEVAPAKESW